MDHNDLERTKMARKGEKRKMEWGVCAFSVFKRSQVLYKNMMCYHTESDTCKAQEESSAFGKKMVLEHIGRLSPEPRFKNQPNSDHVATRRNTNAKICPLSHAHTAEGVCLCFTTRRVPFSRCYKPCRTLLLRRYGCCNRFHACLNIRWVVRIAVLLRLTVFLHICCHVSKRAKSHLAFC